ncbi:MAG TPA: ATP-dependent Clp protease ATP-binding subunit [Blastocatellia bacterium]
MQKQQLLNLLDTDARQAFERAKTIARQRGGVLSPLHLIAALLESISLDSEHAHNARARALESLHESLSARYPKEAEDIRITRETQAAISEASRIAKSEGCVFASSVHLLRAALDDVGVKEVLGDSSLLVSLISESITKRAVAGRLAVQPGKAKASPQTPLQAEGGNAPGSRHLAEALRNYCSDLAEETRATSPHPFVGRERETTAVLETLCRKLKNNPLLIGKPGVGKTALVAAVASRLCEGQVPARLRGKRILEVSRLKLLADAKFAGEVEERVKTLLEEVRRAGDVILFFDEIHTLLGAGGASGTGDVANLLKSSLSKGEISCLGATTLAEYYKYIARDEALARRFSTITIEEPSLEETQRMLNEARSVFESYHAVMIGQEVISFIVEMADRYLHSRSFPDKAFDLLDRAAAKATIAGQERLTRDTVTETLSETTGLPLEIMDEDPADRLARLEGFLNAAVPGQERAARDISRVVRIAKLGLELRPETPDGVFLFVGPEGVGKHEMAAALAKFLYGSSQKITQFDLSQFTEAWSISRLVGAEPGYVGYADRSGLLSKAAEDSPHSVLYFRNIDLAHPVVQQFLSEAFEQGRFTDAAGSKISLSNTTVVMSLSQMGGNNKQSHVGFISEDADERRSSAGLRGTGGLNTRERAFGILESLLATVDEVVEFQVLDRSATEKIIAERLEALGARLESAQPVVVRIDPQLASFFAERLAAERKSLGQLERLLQETIIIPFTHLHVDRHPEGNRPEVTINLEDGSVKLATAGAL